MKQLITSLILVLITNIATPVLAKEQPRWQNPCPKGAYCDWRQVAIKCDEELKIHPDNAEAHFLIAWEFGLRHRYDKSVEHYKLAEKYGYPDLAEIYYHIGYALYRAHKPDEGLVELQLTLHPDSEFIEIYEQQVAILKKLGREDVISKEPPTVQEALLEEALVALEKSIYLGADDIDVFRQRAEILEHLGREDEKSKELPIAPEVEKARELEWKRIEESNIWHVPNRPGHKYTWQERIDACNEELDEHPDNTEALYEKALSLAQLSRDTEAVESFDLALKYGYRNEAWLQYQRGMSLRRSGKLEEAVLAYERSISLGVEYKYVYFERIEVLTELGREEDWDKLIPGDPYNVLRVDYSGE